MLHASVPPGARLHRRRRRSVRLFTAVRSEVFEALDERLADLVEGARVEQWIQHLENEIEKIAVRDFLFLLCPFGLRLWLRRRDPNRCLFSQLAQFNSGLTERDLLVFSIVFVVESLDAFESAS